MEDGLIEVGDYNGKRHKYVTLTEKGEEFSRKTVDLVIAEEIAVFIKFHTGKMQKKYFLSLFEPQKAWHGGLLWKRN